MPKRYTLRGEWHTLAPGLRAIELGRAGCRLGLTLLETSDGGAVSCVVVEKELGDLADHDLVCEAPFQSNRCARVCDLPEAHEGPHQETVRMREENGQIGRRVLVDDAIAVIQTPMGPVRTCAASFTVDGDQQRICELVHWHDGPHMATKAVRLPPEQIQADLAPPPGSATRVAARLGLLTDDQLAAVPGQDANLGIEAARFKAERDEARAVATDLNTRLGAAERKMDEARATAVSVSEQLTEARATIEGCGQLARGAQEALLGAIAALGAQAAAWKAVAGREPGVTSVQREALAWNETANRAILRAKASQGWK